MHSTKVPGHEIIGKVAAVGSGVAGFALGQLVGIGVQRSSCGECGQCNRGREHTCAKITKTYAGPGKDKGGFAERIRCGMLMALFSLFLFFSLRGRALSLSLSLYFLFLAFFSSFFFHPSTSAPPSRLRLLPNICQQLPAPLHVEAYNTPTAPPRSISPALPRALCLGLCGAWTDMPLSWSWADWCLRFDTVLMASCALPYVQVSG